MLSRDVSNLTCNMSVASLVPTKCQRSRSVVIEAFLAAQYISLVEACARIAVDTTGRSLHIILANIVCVNRGSDNHEF